jgi:hypothetical protein
MTDLTDSTQAEVPAGMDATQFASDLLACVARHTFYTSEHIRDGLHGEFKSVILASTPSTSVQGAGEDEKAALALATEYVEKRDWNGAYAAMRLAYHARIAAFSTPPAPASVADEARAEIERLRGLLIDPGDPAWEDARAVLAAELRKAEMPNHARAVENGEGPYVPSWIALNLIAHARLAFAARPAGEGENTLRAIADGDVPRSEGKKWRTDGQPSKLDQCSHEIALYEDCARCIEDFARTALTEGTPS